MKWLVKLGFSKLSTSEKIVTARAIVSQVTGNPHFPVPVPPLSQINSAILALESATTAAATGGSEETALMHARIRELDTLMGQLANHVEIKANTHPEIGDAIILSAGMQVKEHAGRNPNTFGIRNTALVGEVLVTSVAAPNSRASYVWQYSLNPDNPNSWQTAATTIQSTVRINGLTPGKRYSFRAAVVTPTGQGPWQGPLNIIVT